MTRLEARAHAAGRLAGAGSRLQAERSELIWQQEGPAAGREDRRLETWVGGREAWKSGG